MRFRASLSCDAVGRRRRSGFAESKHCRTCQFVILLASLRSYIFPACYAAFAWALWATFLAHVAARDAGPAYVVRLPTIGTRWLSLTDWRRQRLLNRRRLSRDTQMLMFEKGRGVIGSGHAGTKR